MQKKIIFLTYFHIRSPNHGPPFCKICKKNFAFTSLLRTAALVPTSRTDSIIYTCDFPTATSQNTPSGLHYSDINEDLLHVDSK